MNEIEELKLVGDDDINQEIDDKLDTLSLENSTKDIINQIIESKDVEEIKDLTKLFNLNQVKKDVIRVTKLSDLLDKVSDQAIERFEKHPEEFSNKDVLDYMQVITKSIETAQKAVSSIDNTAPIVLNNININTNEDKLDEVSRLKILEAVNALLNYTNTDEDNQPLEVETNTNSVENK